MKCQRIRIVFTGRLASFRFYLKAKHKANHRLIDEMRGQKKGPKKLFFEPPHTLLKLLAA